MIADQPCMWHGGGMWFFPMLMFIIMIIVFFVLAGRGRGGCRLPWWGPEGYYRKGEESDSALEILKKRYANGEITKEEFEQMKKDILS